MADVRIKYVNRTANHHEHITHVGGDSWTWRREDVVQSIENRTNTFFVEEAGRRADVRVRQGVYGKFIQTVADGVWADNLLSLPPCKVKAA